MFLFFVSVFFRYSGAAGGGRKALRAQVFLHQSKLGQSLFLLRRVTLLRWTMYLQSISINLYDGKTGQLLVSGRWRDSFIHAFHRGESVTKELIAEMFGKLKPKAVSAGLDKQETL